MKVIVLVLFLLQMFYVSISILMAVKVLILSVVSKNRFPVHMWLIIGGSSLIN